MRCLDAGMRHHAAAALSPHNLNPPTTYPLLTVFSSSSPVTARPTEPSALAELRLGVDCCAVLPYWPIWAAAQFACEDGYKGLLKFVHVYQDGETLQIESTDGHRAFRYRFPAANWRLPEQGLLLHAKALKKAVSQGKALSVSTSMRVTFYGGAKSAVTELSSLNLAGHCVSLSNNSQPINTVEDCGTVGTYPRINQLWPDTFTNEPGAPYGFNAAYLKQWGAVVEKLSTNAVTRVQGNAPTKPFVFSCTFAECFGEHYADPKLELLLMPVTLK